MEDTKLAWAAGFIDGEGYVGLTRVWYKTHYIYRAQVSVGQVSVIPLQELQSILGGTLGTSRDKFGKHYQWRLNGKNTVGVMQKLLPFLILKKRQAELVVEFYKISNPQLHNTRQQWRIMPAAIAERREELHTMVMALNRRRDRLSEKAPTASAEGDAIVGSHGNENHESVAEMTTPKTVQ